jgi:hypothetical protein
MSANKLVSACAVAIGLLLSGTALAQGVKVSSPVEFARSAEVLKPGEWVWAPQIAPSGPIIVYVDLSRQLATVYRNGIRIGVSTVSTGKPGHETPTGVFQILQKDAKHRSSTYNNAPMPFQQRLTWDGVALHAGGLPGYPESHGCVHLPLEFSRLLFAETDLGGTVIISGRAGSAMLSHSAGVLAPQDEQGIAVAHQPLADDEPYRWTPETAPEGPISIVISRSDQRVVVLRNGQEIGRARAELPVSDFETHVYTFTKLANGQSRWIVVGVPGHAGEGGEPVDAGVLAHLRVPKAFLAAVREVIVPGTTVLLTQAPVLPEHSGKRMTVLADASSK